MKFGLATDAFARQRLCRAAIEGFAVCAMALGSASSALGAELPSGQPLSVITSDLRGNYIDALTLSPGNTISSAATLNSDGVSYLLFDSLAFVPNSAASTATVDIVAASAVKGELVRYSGPNYGSGQVIYPSGMCNRAAAGLRYPTRIAADGAGNLFVVSLNQELLGTPSLWVLPFNSSNGCYRNPILIDKTFGGVRSILLAEVLVAGSTAVASPAGTLWNAGDLLLLAGDFRHSQVLVYARAHIYGADGGIGGAMDPALPLKAPTSIAVTPNQFAGQLGPLDEPLSMDLWPGDPAQKTGVGLLISTTSGRILRFDSGTDAFAVDFARGLELLGLSHLKVGTYLSTPYVFVTKPGFLGGKGAILQFGDAKTGAANTPLQSFSMTVSNPNALAVTTSTSTPVSGCIGATCVIFPGSQGATPEATLNIQCPMAGAPPGTPCEIAQNASNANILAQQCSITDPRVTASSNGDGYNWSCTSSPLGAASLDVAPLCPNLNLPHTLLPPHLCGHAGPTGNQLVVVETTAQVVDLNALNSTFYYALDATQVLPSATYDLTCPNYPRLPLVAWAPRSDLPSVEGTIVEDQLQPFYIDSTGFCDGPGGIHKAASMLAFGIALDPNALPNGLQGFIDGKYTNLQSTLLNASSTVPAQITPAVYATLTNEIANSQAFFDQNPTNSANVNCALSTLVQTNSDVVNNLSAFSDPGLPPMFNINPSGEIIQRISNLYLQINNWFPSAGQAPPTTWPPSSVPACRLTTPIPTTTYSCQSFDAPGAAYTEMWNINDSGQVNATADIGSFIYDMTTATWTPLPAPPAASGFTPPDIGAIGINNAGVIVGGAQAAGPEVNMILGSLNNPLSYQFTAFSNPNVPPTFNSSTFRSASNTGLITGYVTDGASLLGFIFNPTAGSIQGYGPGYTPIVPTLSDGSASTNTIMGGMNLAGLVVGNGTSATQGHEGFVLNTNTGSTLAYTVNGIYTTARAINDVDPYSGTNCVGAHCSRIVGFTVDPITGLYANYYVDFDPVTGLQTPQPFICGGASSTFTSAVAEGINNNDVIAGSWTDAAGNTHGYIATPVVAASPQTPKVLSPQSLGRSSNANKPKALAAAPANTAIWIQRPRSPQP